METKTLIQSVNLLLETYQSFSISEGPLDIYKIQMIEPIYNKLAKSNGAFMMILQDGNATNVHITELLGLLNSVTDLLNSKEVPLYLVINSTIRATFDPNEIIDGLSFTPVGIELLSVLTKMRKSRGRCFTFRRNETIRMLTNIYSASTADTMVSVDRKDLIGYFEFLEESKSKVSFKKVAKKHMGL